MAGSPNKVLLIGRPTRDPELKYLPSGVAVCRLGIATNRYGKDQQTGERREYTDFKDVEVFDQGNRKLAELCGQYLTKGRSVYIEGELRTRSWDDQQTGAKRSKTEVRAFDVQFLDGRGDGAASGGEGGGAVAGVARPASAPEAGGGEIDPDDIPF